jgi:hypothetical protein
VSGFRRFFLVGAFDIRDDADLHIRAMTDAAARGERFLAVTGDLMSMLDTAKVLAPRPNEEAVVATTESLVRLGLPKHKAEVPHDSRQFRTATRP